MLSTAAPVTVTHAVSTASSRHAYHHAKLAPGCQVIATVHFTENSAELAPEEISSLQHISPGDSTVKKVEVLGYCDDIGEAKWNFILSRKRAESAAKVVAASYPSTPLKTEGLGSLDPVGSNKTNKGRALNRRAVVEVCER